MKRHKEATAYAESRREQYLLKPTPTVSFFLPAGTRLDPVTMAALDVTGLGTSGRKPEHRWARWATFRLPRYRRLDAVFAIAYNVHRALAAA